MGKVVEWVMSNKYQDTDIYNPPIEILLAFPCPECSHMSRVTNENGIPDEFAEADMQKFSFHYYEKDMSQAEQIVWYAVQNIEKYMDDKKGFYLWSKQAGSGKTFLACSMGRSISIRYNLRLQFVSSQDYMTTLGEDIDRRKQDAGCRLEAEKYKNADVLILDDLGTEKNNDWTRAEIHKLLEHRKRENKFTIITSNVEQTELKYEPRTISRIQSDLLPIHMPEEAIRAQKAKESNMKLMQKIMNEVKK